VVLVAEGPTVRARALASIFITSPVALLQGVVLLHEQVSPLSIVGAVASVAGALIIRRPDPSR
jgi:drug/metabolite transporter (DMT)-like permease